MSLYLILKILFPPLRSDVGRKMLREFHFAGTTVPFKPPLNPWAAVPLSPSTRLLLFQSTCWLQRAARQPRARSAPHRSSSLHFWLVPVSALRADPVPHAIITGEGQGTAASLSWTGGRTAVFKREPARVCQWLCSVPPWAGLRTLRSAIALSHRRRGCVSRARRSSGRRRDLLWKLVGSAVSQGNPSPSAHIIHTTDPTFLFFVSGAAVWEASCCCSWVSAMKKGIKSNLEI